MKKSGNDHRTRVTRLLIRRAFTELLRQKPIQSISIKELCERAGINRGTFYGHYTDIYDLRDQMEAELYADFEKSLEPLLSARDQNLNPVQISAEIFQCLKENSDVCAVTLSEYGDKKFLLQLLNLGKERCMETYARYFQNVTPKEIEYFYYFVSAGCIGLLQKWLDDGMAGPAGEIAEMAEGIMMQGIGWLEHRGLS